MRTTALISQQQYGESQGPHKVASFLNRPPVRSILSIVVGSCILSWVALYNGAPLVFSDSLMHGTVGLSFDTPPYFSPFYGYGIALLHLGWNLWPVVFAQSLLLSSLIFLVLRKLLPRRAPETFLCIITILSLGSSLPWETGLILPDVLTGALILGIYLLTLSPSPLSTAEQLYLSILVAWAVASHVSHVPLAMALLCLAAVFNWWEKTSHSLQKLAVVTASVTVAVIGLFALTWFGSHQVGLVRDGDVFTLAKLIDEGPAIQYLDKACPQVRYHLCAELSNLRGRTHDDLKWSEDSPFHRIARPVLQQEAREIVASTLKMYLPDVLKNAMYGIAMQFTRFQTADGLSQKFAAMVANTFHGVFGDAVAKTVLDSKQGQGTLPISVVRGIHTAGIAVAALVIILGFTCTEVPVHIRIFIMFVITALACNAAITGALSGPYDRYLARIIWLLLFSALVLATPSFASSNKGSNSNL